MVRKHHQLKSAAALPSLVVIAIFAGGCAANQPTTYEPAPGGEAGRGARLDKKGLEQSMSSASRSLLAMSRTHSDSGNYGQATAALERAIRIEPNQPALWLELGHVRFLEGDYQQAEQFGRKARSLAAGNAIAESLAVRLIADALRGQGRYNAAYLLLSDE